MPELEPPAVPRSRAAPRTARLLPAPPPPTVASPPPPPSPGRSYLQRRRNKAGPAFTYEVIIVDDGSRDGTARVALDYARRQGSDAVRLLRMPHNRGKVRAGTGPRDGGCARVRLRACVARREVRARRPPRQLHVRLLAAAPQSRQCPRAARRGAPRLLGGCHVPSLGRPFPRAPAAAAAPLCPDEPLPHSHPTPGRRAAAARAWQGMAVREGMLIARGQQCLFMDADGATQVARAAGGAGRGWGWRGGAGGAGP